MPRTVLIADDTREVVELISIYLETERRGYRVVRAYDGAQCLEAIRRERPDVVLLDLMMPEMSGQEVLEHLRGDEYKPPTIVMSTRQTRDGEFGAYSQVKVVFRKPMDADKLLAAIDLIAEAGSVQ